MYIIENSVVIKIKRKKYLVTVYSKQYGNKSVAQNIDMKLHKVKLELELSQNLDIISAYSIERLAKLIYDNIYEVNKVNIQYKNMIVTYVEDY